MYEDRDRRGARTIESFDERVLQRLQHGSMQHLIDPVNVERTVNPYKVPRRVEVRPIRDEREKNAR